MLYLIDNSKMHLLKLTRNKQDKYADMLFSNASKELLPIAKYVHSLGYDSEPDYNKLGFMFKKILLDKDLVPEKRHFDWCDKTKIKHTVDIRSNESQCERDRRPWNFREGIKILVNPTKYKQSIQF